MIKKIKGKCPNCKKEVNRLYEIEVSENGNTDFHEVCRECKEIAS
jgi:phage FluMu protein Com